jgi:tetratricopeptide (TPR) repeat protein
VSKRIHHSQFLICVLISLLIQNTAVAASLNEIFGIHKNNTAVRSLSADQDEEISNLDIAKAEKELLTALSADPFNPVIRLNLGLLFEVQKKYSNAIKEYESVARREDVEDALRFAANFNAGNASAQDKKIDLAINYYQRALEIKPDDLDTKKNIEILFLTGGGGGQGDQKDQDQKQDPNNQGQNPNPDQNQPPKQEKPKFDSKNLTKEDVRKILEELKSQEKKIRENENGSKGREATTGKDW